MHLILGDVKSIRLVWRGVQSDYGALPRAIITTMTSPQKYLIQHRSSRWIIRTGSVADSSRAADPIQASATADQPCFPFNPLPNPVRSSPLSLTNPSVDGKQQQHQGAVRQMFAKIGKAFHLGAFNVRTLMQPGQQVALAKTMESLAIDVCCLSETRMQDPTVVTLLTSPDIKTSFNLRTSGSNSRALAGVGIALSRRAEQSLKSWIPISDRLCAVRLMTASKVHARNLTPRCLFIISAYAPTDCASDAVKDSFYNDLRLLIDKANSNDIIIVAGDMNAQVGLLNTSEKGLGGTFALEADRSDNGNRLLQLCAQSRLYLSSTNFRRTAQRCATWRPPNPNRKWTQIDHVAISTEWRGTVQDCRSFWSTPVDSDHALVRCRLNIQFPKRRISHTVRSNVRNLDNPAVKSRFKALLDQNLEDTQPMNLEGTWTNIAHALRSAFTEGCASNSSSTRLNWMSNETVDLLDKRRGIPAGNQFNRERRVVRKLMKASIRNDRESWWTKKAEEMEEAYNAGNSRKLFQLIRNTGSKVSGVSEVVNEADGTKINDKDRRLCRWAEFFEEQFNWPNATHHLDIPQCDTWSVNMDPPSKEELECFIRKMKRNKAAGPDDLSPALFKEGGDGLLKHLEVLFKLVWDTESVPASWGLSSVVPLYKKGRRDDCSNHRGVSLTPVVARILGTILVSRLREARESQIREEQGGFRPGRGCVDQIFTLRRILEYRGTYNRPTIAVFLDFKGAFDSVDRMALFTTLIKKGVPLKYVNILRSLYAQSLGNVRVYK